MARRQSGSTSTGPRGSVIRRSRHRQYGLSNANQVLLVLIVTALFFFALLRSHWLEFDGIDVSAGLWAIVVPEDVNNRDDASNSSVSVSWRAFCDPKRGNFMLPLADGFTQPISLDSAKILCDEHPGGAYLPEIIRVLVATAIGFSILTLVFALYLHLGRLTRSQIFYFGSFPALALFVSAVLGTVSLILWQSSYGKFNNGDCFAITIAATVIAYLVAISMVIRWRWPGICAVPNEQQAFQTRAYRFGSRRDTGAVPPASQPLEGVLVETNEPPPRSTNFHQMRG